MTMRARLLIATLVLPSLTISHSVLGQDINVLAQCRSQSQDLDQVHACMDNYLDVMDGNMRAITEFLGESLSGDSLAGLNQSQQAFVEYRRQNCLWYLEFSSPRGEAEQIAKNCLASMSRQRLQELQDLVTTDDQSGQTIAGFYVYGAERNSFQPCGSEERYWVEGVPSAVGLIQQTYLSVSTNERQLLHAIVVGKLDKQLQAPDEHAGVLELSSFIELRVPTDSDCRLPNRPFGIDISASDIDATNQTREVEDDEQVEQDEPEQQLTAYFGQWLVDCVEISGRKFCSLEVPLTRKSGTVKDVVSESDPRLIVNRTPRLSTFIELEFPDREIDSPTLIRWTVDTKLLGDIVQSEIRVDQAGTRQLISESSFLDKELLPLMISGQQVIINILKTVDDNSGEALFGTLQGLTKALAFADDFVEDDVWDSSQ